MHRRSMFLLGDEVNHPRGWHYESHALGTSCLCLKSGKLGVFSSPELFGLRTFKSTFSAQLSSALQCTLSSTSMKWAIFPSHRSRFTGLRVSGHMPVSKEIKAQWREQHRDTSKFDFQPGILRQCNGMTSTKVKRCDSTAQLSETRDLEILNEEEWKRDVKRAAKFWFSNCICISVLFGPIEFLGYS